MNYLAIDTSGKNLTIILCKNGEVIKYYDPDCGVNHSVTLMPKLESLLIENDFDLKTADFFAVTIGAGSFTGIRIGVSTVKALCFAYNKKCLGVTSFDIIAYNEEKGKVLAVIDAGHDSFYVAGYENKRLIKEPSFISIEQLLELKKEYALLSAFPISGQDTKVVNSCDGFCLAINELKGNATFDYDSVNPLYVRKSQAEEGRK